MRAVQTSIWYERFALKDSIIKNINQKTQSYCKNNRMTFHIPLYQIQATVTTTSFTIVLFFGQHFRSQMSIPRPSSGGMKQAYTVSQDLHRDTQNLLIHVLLSHLIRLILLELCQSCNLYHITFLIFRGIEQITFS